MVVFVFRTSQNALVLLVHLEVGDVAGTAGVRGVRANMRIYIFAGVGPSVTAH